MPDPVVTQKCPQCQSPVQAGDRFCGVCGATLATGQIPCPNCGKSVPANSQFCGHCGRPIHAPSPEIRRHRWWRSPEEVAVRFDAANLPDLIYGFTGVKKQGLVDWGKEKAARMGLLDTGFVIEEGTLAVLFQHGVAEVFGPGSYGGGDLKNRLSQILAGEPMVLAMMDGGPVELPLAIEDLLTAESVKVATHCRLVVQIKDPVVFHTVCVKGVKRVTRRELADRLAPEARLALLDALSGTPAKSLRTGTELQSQLERKLDGDLRAALQPWGLWLTDVRGLTVSGEVLERFTSQQGQLYERGANWTSRFCRRPWISGSCVSRRPTSSNGSGRDTSRIGSRSANRPRTSWSWNGCSRNANSCGNRTRWRMPDAWIRSTGNWRSSKLSREVADHQRQTVTRVEKTAVDLEGEFQETSLEVGQAEKLADLYRRAETVKLDRLRTEEDVDKVVAELNKSKALRDDDVETLKQGLMDRREDHELARSYLLKKISLEQELEQQRIRLQAGQEMDAASVEHELALRRQQFEAAQTEERTLHERSVTEERNRIRLAEEADQADLRTLEQMRRLNQSDAEHAMRMEAERLKARSGASVAALLSLMREQGGAGGSAEVRPDAARAGPYRTVQGTQHRRDPGHASRRFPRCGQDLPGAGHRRRLRGTDAGPPGRVAEGRRAGTPARPGDARGVREAHPSPGRLLGPGDAADYRHRPKRGGQQSCRDGGGQSATGLVRRGGNRRGPATRKSRGAPRRLPGLPGHAAKFGGLL